jgi:DNA-binding MarR family transcriptional regulator
LLQRLEQSGFVTRKPSPDDRRAVVVDTTRAGRALRDRVMQAWSDLEALTTAGFTADEHEQALRVLNRIEANLCTVSPEGDDAGRVDGSPVIG